MYRSRKRSPGFTLVELLVVITIIGMLMGLLLPAVQAARESGRRAVCNNSLYNLSRAAQSYESARRQYPGFHMQIIIPQNNNNNNNNVVVYNVGWMVMLMPNIERSDIWTQWKQGAGNPVFIKLLICPSDPPDTINTMSIPTVTGANYAGTEGPTSYQCNGFVFQDGKGLSQDYISSHDGTSMTLMLSENQRVDNIGNRCKIHYWWDPITNTTTPSAGAAMSSSVTPVPAWQAVSFGAGAPSYLAYVPLGNTQSNTPFLAGSNYVYPPNISSTSGNWGNISSNHGSGSNAAFCDGHTLFLRSDMDPVTYWQLVCPYDAGASTFPTGVSLNNLTPLNENNFTPP